MRKESEAILLRIFIGESDKFEGKLLYKYLIEQGLITEEKVKIVLYEGNKRA